jgi:hypothetical protein
VAERLKTAVEMLKKREEFNRRLMERLGRRKVPA